MEKFTLTNKDLWNAWTKLHATSSFYDVTAFKAGETSLRKIELAELTEVKNKRMLHLQCHFGLDSISWARKGAAVTAVDFAEDAIELAKKLSKEVSVPVEFICANIYDLPAILNEKFDIVYTSYGVLGWLNDLNKWAEIITHYLQPKGTFYIVEFHPFLNMLGKDLETINLSYFHGRQPVERQWQGSYAAKDVDLSHDSYIWPYTISEVVNALRRVGLIIDFMHEFPFSVYDCFHKPLKEINDGEYVIQEHESQIPLTFSIKATYYPELSCIK